MLDRQFLRKFFDQLETMKVDELDRTIEQVQQVQRVCASGSEAAQDARFLLRHLRRRRLELVLTEGSSRPRSDA